MEVSLGMTLTVEYEKKGDSPEGLRREAMLAPHARTRERLLALYEISQGRNASEVGKATGRHPQTVMDWVHRYNADGKDGLRYRRTGGRPPLCTPPSPRGSMV